MRWGAEKTNELLLRFERALKTRYAAEMVKRMVFRRVAELKAEGFVEDVAFIKALREHNLKF